MRRGLFVMNWICFLLLLIVLISCEQSVGPSIIENLLSVDTVNFAGKTQNGFYFTVTVEAPTPGYSLSRIQVDRLQGAFDVRIYGEIESNALNPQVLDYFFTSFDVTIQEAGEYLFRFHRVDLTTIDTTLVFP